jgi:intracellular sulfur oxidation DsrE/DsrF family protein
MKMKSKLMILAVLGMAATNVAFAQGDTTCPVTAQLAMDQEFGYGTSANTSCIEHRHHIRVALSMSSATANPKSGFNQVLNNALSMTGNYEQVYGLTYGDEGYRIAVVAHFQGAKSLLSDDAYFRLFGTTNPNTPVVKKLLAKGVQLIMCQTTMRANGWKSSDLAPGVTQVPGGVVQLADFANSGWVVMTP